MISGVNTQYYFKPNNTTGSSSNGGVRTNIKGLGTNNGEKFQKLGSKYQQLGVSTNIGGVSSKHGAVGKNNGGGGGGKVTIMGE